MKYCEALKIIYLKSVSLCEKLLTIKLNKNRVKTL